VVAGNAYLLKKKQQ